MTDSMRTIGVLFATMLTVSLAPAAAKASALKIPLGITVDDSGNLYVANSGNNNVLVYDKTYALSTTLTGSYSSPVSVAVGNYGRWLFVANVQSKTYVT